MNVNPRPTACTRPSRTRAMVVSRLLAVASIGLTGLPSGPTALSIGFWGGSPTANSRGGVIRNDAMGRHSTTIRAASEPREIRTVASSGHGQITRPSSPIRSESPDSRAYRKPRARIFRPASSTRRTGSITGCRPLTITVSAPVTMRAGGCSMHADNNSGRTIVPVWPRTPQFHRSIPAGAVSGGSVRRNRAAFGRSLRL